MGALRSAFTGGVYRPLLELSRGLRPGTRPAWKARRAGLRFREAAQSWSSDERSDWALQRLREETRRAAQEIPFWQARFRSVGFDPRRDFSFDDFAHVPILERAELQAAGLALVSPAVPAPQVHRDATGGSTGSPTTVWKGPRERGWAEAGAEHFLRRLGVGPGARRAYVWGHHLDPVARDTWQKRARDWCENTQWFDCLRLSEDILDRHHRALERWRPDVIIAYAGAVAELAAYLDRAGLQPDYPRQAIVTGAEKLYPHQRELVERVFRVPAAEQYGGRDVGLIGFQSRAPGSRAFEVNWAQHLIEPAEALPEAGILVTKLQGDAMPLFRYRVGDVGRFPGGAAPGHPAWELLEVIGRQTMRLWHPAGHAMNGLAIPHLLKDFPIQSYQVRQAADYQVLVAIVPSPGYDATAEAQVLRVLQSNLPGVPIRVEVVTAIPRTAAGKWMPVVSDVQR